MGAIVESNAVRATPTRYSVPGWGDGELWMRGRVVLATSRMSTAENRRRRPCASTPPLGATSLPTGTLVAKSSQRDIALRRLRTRRTGQTLATPRRIWWNASTSPASTSVSATSSLDFSWATPFQHAGADALRRIPRGEVVTYASSPRSPDTPARRERSARSARTTAFRFSFRATASWAPAGSEATERRASLSNGGCWRWRGASFRDHLRRRERELARIAPSRPCDQRAELSALFTRPAACTFEQEAIGRCTSIWEWRRGPPCVRAPPREEIRSEIRTYRRRAFDRATRYQLHVAGDADALRVLEAAGVVDRRHAPRAAATRSRRSRMLPCGLLAWRVPRRRSISVSRSPHLELRTAPRRPRRPFSARSPERTGIEPRRGRASEALDRVCEELGGDRVDARADGSVGGGSRSRSARWSPRRARVQIGSPMPITPTWCERAARRTSSSRPSNGSEQRIAWRGSRARFARPRTLRLRHPTDSLRELAARTDPPVTKAAVHRRLRRLEEPRRVVALIEERVRGSSGRKYASLLARLRPRRIPSSSVAQIRLHIGASPSRPLRFSTANHDRASDGELTRLAGTAPNTEEWMAIRVGINGFGRIGRNFFRAQHALGADIAVVALNDLGDARTMAHLLSLRPTSAFPGEVEPADGVLRAAGEEMRMPERDPAALPWKLGVDVVLESTGFFTDREGAQKHLDAGAKKVVISAPASDPDITVVLGVNDDAYDPAAHDIVSNASCTTNCVAPMAKILHELGDRVGLHDDDPRVHERSGDTRLPAQDLRRARAAAINLIPTTTGAAKAIGLVLPELQGKVDGISVRAPSRRARSPTSSSRSDARRRSTRSRMRFGELPRPTSPGSWSTRRIPSSRRTSTAAGSLASSTASSRWCTGERQGLRLVRQRVGILVPAGRPDRQAAR